MRTKRCTALGLVLLLALAACQGTGRTARRNTDAAWHTPTEVQSMQLADAFARAEALTRRYGARNVLLVFDLDNTLLAMSTDVGSDQWFDWQRDLPKDDERRVAEDFPGLLRAQGVLFRLGTMRLTEPETAGRLRALQQRGCRTMVLTARGPETWPSTRRELDRHGLRFRDFAPGPAGGWTESYQPWDGARDVLYRDGVMLVAGQDKGRALKTLLTRVGARPLAVVFADDKQKNVDQFADDFTGRAPETWMYRYGGEDAAVKRFHANPAPAAEQWKLLEPCVKQLQAVFGETYSVSK